MHKNIDQEVAKSDENCYFELLACAPPTRHIVAWLGNFFFAFKRSISVVKQVVYGVCEKHVEVAEWARDVVVCLMPRIREKTRLRKCKCKEDECQMCSGDRDSLMIIMMSMMVWMIIRKELAGISVELVCRFWCCRWGGVHLCSVHCWQPAAGAWCFAVFASAVRRC